MEETKNVLASSAIGGAVGAGAYSAIGGVGIAAMGTAVGVTLAPFIGIGAGLGILGYSIYRLGKRQSCQS